MNNCAPRFLSETPEGTDISTAEHGVEALGLTLLPQGVNTARVLEAKNDQGRPLYRRTVVQYARRSAKTTAIAATLVGRCATIPGYRVVSTAQTRSIARLVWLEIANALELNGEDVNVRLANGTEELRWSNGSTWRIAPPKASGFRSQAADAVWIDEAGELTEEQTRDLVSGALPLLDTRPHAQLIVSGTPALSRGGLLWEELTAARGGKAGRGIVDYSMTPGDDPTSEAVWLRVHPGLASGLTSLEVIRERFDGMPLQSFAREYLCADPTSASIAAIDPAAWSGTSIADLLEIPATGVALAFATAREDAAGAIAAAWFTPEGRAVVQLLDYRAGIAWMPRALVKALEGHNVAVAFDSIGSNTAVHSELNRLASPGLMRRVQAVTARESAAGVSALMSALTEGTLTHAVDRDLDAAAEGAAFRWLGDSRLWGRRTSSADVSPLEAAGLALWLASGMRTTKAVPSMTRRFT